jgi:hypothetical protein
MQQSCSPLQNSHFPLETSGAPMPYINQPHQGSPLSYSLTNSIDNQGSMHLLDPAFCRTMNSQHPFLNGISDSTSQVKNAQQCPVSSNLYLYAVILRMNTLMHHRLGLSGKMIFKVSFIWILGKVRKWAPLRIATTVS